jgi:hypothetical protein
VETPGYVQKNTGLFRLMISATLLIIHSNAFLNSGHAFCRKVDGPGDHIVQ